MESRGFVDQNYSLKFCGFDLRVRDSLWLFSASASGGNMIFAPMSSYWLLSAPSRVSL